MNIVFRMSIEDYFELAKFKNCDKDLTRSSRIIYKLSIIILIIAINLSFFEDVYPYYIPMMVVSGILLMLWIIFSDDMFNRARYREIRKITVKQFSSSIELIRDTRITLNEEAIIKECDGMYSKTNWNCINNINVTQNNIFINLISCQTIIIPIKVFNSKDEQEMFLEYIDDKINSNLIKESK